MQLGRLVPGLLAVLALTASAATPPSPATVKIDPVKTYGVWEGWGTSLAWWAKIFGDRDDLADLLFTTKTVSLSGQSLPGLGLNIARYNAGACSWNQIGNRKMIVSKTILPFRQMEGFWLDGQNADPKSKSWNWEVDANQRAMLKKARDRGADHFELFSNSPMWWMCANDNPSGAAKGTVDNLPPKNFQAFATYLAAVARQAKENWGVSFTTVDPFNEPNSEWWSADCKQEGCHFSPATQAAFLPILRAELDRQGLRTLPISASDESLYDQAVETWKRFGPPTRALVSQVNVHGYQGQGGDRAGLYRMASKTAGKRIWNSEHGDGKSDGLDLARNFHRDLHDLHPVAWSYWQPLDGGGWGLLPADLAAGTIEKANPKFFVLAQYSRHIRPGMTILDSSDPNTTAAYDPKTRKLVLVTLNDGPARRLTYDLSRFVVSDGPVPSALTEPKGTARYEISRDLQIKNKRLEAEFPADSIRTFEISSAMIF